MDSKIKINLWIGLILTFLGGMFFLSIGQASAVTSAVDQSNETAVTINQWTGMLFGLALALLIILIAMIIVRRRFEKRKKNSL